MQKTKVSVSILFGLVCLAVFIEAMIIGYVLAHQAAQINRISERINMLAENLSTVSARLATYINENTNR
jgi:hypothetical protein